MSEDPLAKYLTLQQAGERLKISYRTLERMIFEGRIAAIKHGGKLLISEDEIADYFKRLESQGAKKRAARAKKNPHPTTVAGRRVSLSGVESAAG